MGLLSYLRGDDLREQQPAGEPRSLPRPDNELPLSGAFTAYGAFGRHAVRGRRSRYHAPPGRLRREAGARLERDQEA